MNNLLIRNNLYKKIQIIESSQTHDSSSIRPPIEDFTVNFLIEKTNINKLKLKIVEKKGIDIDDYFKIRLFTYLGCEIIDEQDFTNYIENESNQLTQISQSVLLFFTTSM